MRFLLRDISKGVGRWSHREANSPLIYADISTDRFMTGPAAAPPGMPTIKGTSS
ncbi:hypothetical protein [Rhodococcus sp. USK13]|uniref:hypothetical protein n=1 Tax=Rhodococcus sp. USK13 TaxID=2806442 RepID=UPI001BCF95AC|nr:hypothetical protein [Rhodococcus sp. USK13]